MREIKVSQECIGCGQCSMQSSYMEETADGTAVFMKGKDVSDADLSDVKKMIEECPVHALSLQETSATDKQGMEAVNEIVRKLEKDIQDVQISRISERDVPFKPDDYSLVPMDTSKEYDARYSSESQARSAAKSEFEKLLYSESAFRPMIKEVFVEYKVRVLKPYYTYENNNSSFFYQYNEKYAQKLRTYYSDLQRVFGGKCNLPESWKEFEVYPATGKGKIDTEIDPVRFFDERSMSSGVMAEMRSDSYTSLSYYVDQMDYDYNEEYAGEGIFGSKIKKKWYFSGFYQEANEFVKDLLSAMKYADPGIEGSAVSAVNSALEIYENKVKKELQSKLSELQNSVK